ncbi:MAG: transcriptional regulator NrdR [Planctomycetota bacterium]
MRCPYCQEEDDRVVNSRSTEGGEAVKRRRECNNCSRRYTTYERVEEKPLKVVKKDGSREEFSRQKLREGLDRACEKRPVSTDAIDSVVSELETTLREKFEREVPAEQVGKMVMEKLRELDSVAYIRFASVYRNFKDVTDFAEEAQTMLQEEESDRNDEQK